jgi:uncharacterized protein (DUF3084 family)
LDFLPIAFLILFVILGGIIAVVADNVGRTLGKKRLRVGRLRPKHTAMLGTFIVGALISIFTIMLVTIVSSDVRQWILEGRRAVQQRDAALQDLRRIEGQLKAQEQVYGKLDKDYRAKVSEVQKQAKKLAALQKQIGELTPQITKLQGSVNSANLKIARLDLERARTQRELAAKQSLLAKAQQSLKIVEQQRILQERLAKAAAQDKQVTDRRNQELTHTNEELEKSIGSLKNDIGRLQTDKTDLESAREKAQQELNLAQTDLQNYRAQLATAQNELSSVTQQYQQIQAAAQFLAGSSSQARFQPVAFQIGEEVFRQSTEGGLSVNKAEDALTGLLRSARVAAIARGAKASDQTPEAMLTPQADPDTKERIPPEIVARQIVQKIAASKDPLVMVAYASMNAFRGEPVFLDVSVLPDPMVYARGQVIATAQIDGNKGEELILKQLEDLLGVRVRERAQSDHMIARMGSDQFGEVSPVEIYKLMSQVKAAGRQVRVQAVAAADTRAGDPLKLEFRVR